MTYINNLKRMSETYGSQLAKWCHPVYTYFDVRQVCVARVCDDGQLTAINTSNDLWNYYLDNQCYLSDPLLKSPKFIMNGSFAWSSYREPEYSNKALKDFADLFDIHQGITFIIKDEQGYFSVAFGSDDKNKYFISKMQQNNEIVFEFVKKLREHCTPIINEILPNAVNMTKLVESKFLIPNEQALLMKDKWGFLKLSNQINNEDVFLLEVTLSLRQKQCANLYLSGYTTKEVADILGIKYTTALDYYASLKRKLRIRYKKDLFHLLKKLQWLGVLEISDYYKVNNQEIN